MKALKTRYDFYKMTEAEQHKMLGRPFTELITKGSLYFPVKLVPEEFNYGKSYGLLIILPIQKNYRTGGKWWKVGVVSPDDLDLDLEFEEGGHLRQDVIEFLKVATKLKIGWTYRGLLEAIRDHAKGGEIK